MRDGRYQRFAGATQITAVVQSLIGHDDAATAALYVNVGQEAMEKVAAALPEIG